ncbi:MAG: transcriptional regulator BetI [Neomegalonema sp.]|nr:transcriptional regulator BetI [Neomegalonema sp.]
MANGARTRKKSADRRDELIRATLESIGEACSLDVTVGEIARRAGVSSALAHHYFGGKDDLFLAAMRSLLTAFRNDVVARLSEAETSRTRLSAIVCASFAPAQFAPNTVAAWTIFYAKAQSSPRYGRLLRVYVRRLRSNLQHELRGLPVAGDLEDAAEAIAAMIDGLYLRQGLQRAPAERERAIAITEKLIDGLLAHSPLDSGWRSRA